MGAPGREAARAQSRRPDAVKERSFGSGATKPEAEFRTVGSLSRESSRVRSRARSLGPWDPAGMLLKKDWISPRFEGTAGSRVRRKRLDFAGRLQRSRIFDRRLPDGRFLAGAFWRAPSGRALSGLSWPGGLFHGESLFRGAAPLPAFQGLFGLFGDIAFWRLVFGLFALAAFEIFVGRGAPPAALLYGKASFRPKDGPFRAGAPSRGAREEDPRSESQARQASSARKGQLAKGGGEEPGKERRFGKGAASLEAKGAFSWNRMAPHGNI